MPSWDSGKALLVAGLLAIAGRVGALAQPQEKPAPATSPDSDTVAADPSADGEETVPSEPVRPPQPVTLEQARERAELLHRVYAATLEAVHTNYFEGCRGVAPARAMKDIFRDVQQETGIEARWISASFKAMNIGHEPRTEFEERASRELARGADPLEIVEDGFYRRAAGVPFQGSCIGCHSENFGSTSPRRKYAGLVISVPVLPPAAAASEQ